MASQLTKPQGGFSSATLRMWLATVGVVALFLGLATALTGIAPDITPALSTPRIFFAVGVLLLGVYVALDPEDFWAKVSGRGAIASGNTLAIALAALVILGLVNVVGSRYQTKVDLTANKQFTLSDQSIKVAQALPAPVKVTGYLTSTDSRKSDFQTLLSDYANRSGGKITYEFIDPEARPGDAIAAGITATGTIVYQMADKKQESTGTTEKDVSTALVKLERPGKKVYFTTGHGERSLDGFGPQDYGTIKQALERDNFATAPLNLVTARTVPDDADEIVIAGAANPFLAEEKDALRAYLDGGGKVIAILGPNSKTDLNDLLQKYEVAFTGNVVVDPAKGLPQDPRVVVVDSYGTHAITTNLRDLSFFPLSTNITYPASPAGGATVTPLAQSSPQSWGNTNPQQIQKQDSDPSGPLALAVAVDAGGGATASVGTQTSRLVLIGAPDLISNNALQQVPGNQTLFLNAANWVAQQDNLIDIRAPDTTPRTMVLTGPQMNLVAYSSFLFLPLAVLAAGAVVWWLRR
ncbi:MAG TPA: GldG family protein [Chloroflexota bacterium]|jgi:ABC-type uncharacterized transport system involved in gliding motility auxiliary subunit|nr:GldG family protein [Chloroflexota bacterium]